MGWAIGYDKKRNRDIGYGVPATCDHPGCNKEIDRGLGYVCGNEPYGGEKGCGLYFCGKHRLPTVCERCMAKEQPFELSPDTPEWIRWKLKHPSWQQWRNKHPEEVEKMTASLKP